MLILNTKISIKDNSGILQGRVINKGSPKKAARLGYGVKISVSKAQTKTCFKHQKAIKPSHLKGSLQDLIIIQTKKSITRYDGSTVKFEANSGLTVNSKGASKKRHVLGFKRINTCVPFELRSARFNPALKAMNNLIKLAKHLL